MKALFSTQITNDPKLTGVERHADVYRALIDGYHESLDINLKVRYLKDNEDLGFTKEFNLVVNNNMWMMVRDANFAPIPNPDYDAEAEIPQEEFITAPAFDYLMGLVFGAPIPSEMLLSGYIQEEAQDGRFD